MNSIINAAIDRSRAVLLVLLMIFIAGSIAYSSIPKENSPDVSLPIIYISVIMEGISPEDAERMIIRPLEQELRGIDGLKELRANASLGRAAIVLEFQAGFDDGKALDDVREKVDLAKPDLPDEAEEPIISEVNFSLFPVINVILTGDIPERTLIKLARDLRDKLEAIPSVLDIDIGGNREEALDVVVDPLLLESYQLTLDAISLVTGNNKLVAAGNVVSKNGSFSVQVPGLLETLEDVRGLPVKRDGDAVITLGDVAQLRKSYKDPESFAHVNSYPAVVLEVKKRTGENIIETIEAVRDMVATERQYWPNGIQVIYSQDQSKQIYQMLSDLQNNIVFAMILVLVVVIAAVGVKSGSFVALAIPGSFLFSIVVLALLGFTLNIVVLFSLILSIGLLVDSAIVVTEDADRRMMDGIDHKTAYPAAGIRMSWPIIASTLTTLAVFMPLLFWPGVVGQFMKYMPITLIATLTGSLLMALIFIPVIGVYFGKKSTTDEKQADRIRHIESGDIHNVGGFAGKYISLLKRVLRLPGLFTFFMVIVLTAVYVIYGLFNVGTEFFPEVEPENAQVQVRARGNLSVYGKDALMKEVETRILNMDDEIRIFYTRAGSFEGGGRDLPEDTIGVIQLEFQHWRIRRKADAILAEIKERTADIPGIEVDARKAEEGPPTGKPIELEISSRYPELLAPTVTQILDAMQQTGGFVEIEDSRPVPAIEWRLELDREKALRYGLTVQSAGEFIKLVTRGLKVTSYRPDDSDDEVDVMLRYPEEHRSIAQLDNLRVITPQGAVPLGNFVKRVAVNKTNRIERVDQRRVMTVKADVAEGLLAANQVEALSDVLRTMTFDPKVNIQFKGEDEEQKEAANFLQGAFGLALFTMALILVIQFNSLYHMAIIMSAVFLSTVGVLLGLLITGQPFGIVMCGVGIISLAGIVVNNNIIFIDTYKVLRQQGMDSEEAMLRTGAQRLRPILLTAVTTVLGLIPMILAMNIDFLAPDVFFGAPSTQWWRQLSTTIAGGLSFATILTLFLTPALIMLGERRAVRRSAEKTGGYGSTTN